jgi:4-hydroxy-4-methyl-2-oxoglutarate aldolase
MSEDAELWSAFGTATLSDALDRLGITGQALGIRALSASLRMVGRAFTGLYQPVDIHGGTVGDYIDDVRPGSVVVLDNGGRDDVTVWGDILTTVASLRGVAGTVIDGACRDSNRSIEVGYPIYSRAVTMRTGKDRVQLVQHSVPVSIGGVRVHPDDLVIGDGDGVVIVPAEREDVVHSVALEIADAEEQIRRLIRSGSRLDEARAQGGYFALQRHTGR